MLKVTFLRDSFEARYAFTFTHYEVKNTRETNHEKSLPTIGFEPMTLAV